MNRLQSALAEQLKRDVYDLCLPAGRMVGSEGHKMAERFLLSRLADTGCEPYAGDSFHLPYSDSGVEFVNLVGVIPGSNRSLPPLLVGAHYDSVIAAPCADDNGAAVAICLAVALMAKESGGLDRDLIIAIFDAEEPPYFLSESMGSNRFYADQLDDRGVHFALIFDLVGHDVSLPGELIPLIRNFAGMAEKDIGLPFLKSMLFMTGAESNPELSRIVVDAGVPRGLKLVATLNDYVGDMSDHGVFRRNGVPYLFFSCGRWAHYHQPSDTPDRLNYDKMSRITQLSIDILERVAKEPLSQRSDEDHTLQYEIKTLRDGFGVTLPLVMRYLGLSKLETREDIRKIVDGILTLGV